MKSSIRVVCMEEKPTNVCKDTRNRLNRAKCLPKKVKSPHEQHTPRFFTEKSFCKDQEFLEKNVKGLCRDLKVLANVMALGAVHNESHVTKLIYTLQTCQITSHRQQRLELFFLKRDSSTSLLFPNERHHFPDDVRNQEDQLAEDSGPVLKQS